MQFAAHILVGLAGVWLIFVAGVMATRPEAARSGIRAAGSTVFLQWAEHLIRGSVGLAMVLAAETARMPQVFTIAGSFILVTSVIILALPRRWHQGYAQACADALAPWAIRVLSPLSLAGGIWLIWAVV